MRDKHCFHQKTSSLFILQNVQFVYCRDKCQGFHLSYIWVGAEVHAQCSTQRLLTPLFTRHRLVFMSLKCHRDGNNILRHTHACRWYVMTCLPVLIDLLKWRRIQIMLFFSEAELIIVMVLHCHCNCAVDNWRGECKMTKSWLYVRFMLVRVYFLNHCSEYQ